MGSSDSPAILSPVSAFLRAVPRHQGPGTTHNPAAARERAGRLVPIWRSKAAETRPIIFSRTAMPSSSLASFTPRDKPPAQSGACLTTGCQLRAGTTHPPHTPWTTEDGRYMQTAHMRPFGLVDVGVMVDMANPIPGGGTRKAPRNPRHVQELPETANLDCGTFTSSVSPNLDAGAARTR